MTAANIMSCQCDLWIILMNSWVPWWLGKDLKVRWIRDCEDAKLSYKYIYVCVCVKHQYILIYRLRIRMFFIVFS